MISACREEVEDAGVDWGAIDGALSPDSSSIAEESRLWGSEVMLQICSLVEVLHRRIGY
jgi:hypothetical protein